MKTRVSLKIEPDMQGEAPAFIEVKFAGEHLKSLDDAILGGVIREAMAKAEQFIERKLGQINAARN